jgi:hypothetical protein
MTRKIKRFLKNIRLEAVAGVDEPAHGFPGWLVMKSADAGEPDSVAVAGWCVEGFEDLADESAEFLIKSTHIPPKQYDMETLVERAFSGRVNLT